MEEMELIAGKLYFRTEDGAIAIIEKSFEIEMLIDISNWFSNFDD